MAINCGAIPAELIESESFGHVRGSFTGAMVDAGSVAGSRGGTIFLDEITETTRHFQVNCCELTGRRDSASVESQQTREVRVIAASNRDIEEDVREGRFRKDLFYRLNAVTLHLPPLRIVARTLGRWPSISPGVSWLRRQPVSFSPEAFDCWNATTGPGTFANSKTRSSRRRPLRSYGAPGGSPERIRASPATF